MMSSSDNTTALAENKVLILYILNQLNSGIIEDGLYKIIASINDVNYFYFKEVLTDVYFFSVGLLVCFTNFGWKNKMPSKSVKRALKLSTDCKCRYY